MKNKGLFLILGIFITSLPLFGFICDDCDSCPGDSAPNVASTSPGDGDTGIAIDAVFSVTFNEPIDVTTVTGNGGAGCIGTIQVIRLPESENYCVQLSASPTVSNLNKTFTFTHAVFESGKTYKVKVTTDVKDSSSGIPLSSEYISTTGFTTQ